MNRRELLELIKRVCALPQGVDEGLLIAGLRRPSFVMLDCCGVPRGRIAWAIDLYDDPYLPVGPTIGQWWRRYYEQENFA